MSEPEPLHEHALSNLRYIREAMERASAFTTIPGWGGFWVGVTAIAAAAIAYPLGATRGWATVWLVEAALAAVIGAVATARKGRRGNVSFSGAPARRFFMSYFAPIGAGAAITLLLVRSGHYGALPAVWLLLYGVSIISAGAHSIALVPTMGFCFMALGTAAVFVPFPAASILMGLGFGVVHVVFGVLIARRHGG